MKRLERRAEVLFAHGASAQSAEELLAYTQLPDYGQVRLPLQIPVPSELHIAAWQQYAVEAEQMGTFAALSQRFSQLRFPIRAGISLSDAYQAATRRGDYTAAQGQTGLKLQHPDQLQLCLHQSLAGTIPVLLTHGRHDFVALVQAMTKKSEPEPIPDSMGACIVAGYTNWDRIQQLRQEWDCSYPPSTYSEFLWREELRDHIQPHKQLYQDTFIILSDGDYSGVAAEALGLSPEEWGQASLTIRLEHECCHYLMRRLLSKMRNHLLDEFIADMRGIVAAEGSYRADWFLHFMGLEAYPHYREGSRLELYRGTPPLSDKSFSILQRLIKAAAVNLESYYQKQTAQWNSASSQVQLVLALACLTLEELAAPESQQTIEQAMAGIREERDWNLQEAKEALH